VSEKRRFHSDYYSGSKDFRRKVKELGTVGIWFGRKMCQESASSFASRRAGKAEGGRNRRGRGDFKEGRRKIAAMKGGITAGSGGQLLYQSKEPEKKSEEKVEPKRQGSIMN